ncbi:sigma factor G inhibitor Gin [Inediibacterium massiliense]|uniref:sigma factor G inhibitor Gin n=1 Tax=Inediibacterium massiliense TaxID=1658111 RepID=UPI0006B64C33|nr:sigma factor G inhibitor Gin [Inediibacterium massiliense]
MHPQRVRCYTCKEETIEYINFLDEYICRECEQKITKIKEDDLEYEYYNILFKKMWHKFLISM